MRTLLIDGNWNLKRNFAKRENMFAKGEHCGGSFGFLDSLRSVVNKTLPDRCVCFWDGPMSGKLRFDIFPGYKSKRKDFDEDSYMMNDLDLKEEAKRKYSSLQQKIKVKNYLEELYIRQAEVELIEGDDLIALYALTRDEDEEVEIFSADKDYYSLITDKVSVIRPSDNLKLTPKNFREAMGYTHENALMLKCFEGDDSDEIPGIKGVALTTILKHFPRFADEKYTIDRLIEEAVFLYSKNKLKVFEKVIGCRQVFERNRKLMDLTNPFVNEIARQEVADIHQCVITNDDDVTQRSITNAMKMMINDGYKQFVYQENLDMFFRPFYRLVTKEKEFTKKMLQG